MTGKERTLRALYFQEPDRAPIMGGYFSHGPFIVEHAASLFYRRRVNERAGSPVLRISLILKQSNERERR